MLRHGKVWYGKVGQSMARCGKARFGRQGRTRLGRVWLGWARHGRQGVARLVKVW